MADDFFFTECWGSAQRLSNGNTLIDSSCTKSGNTPSRIFEVTPDGKKVFELWLTTASGKAVGGYAAAKVPVPIEVYKPVE